jgi:hypothetical protein
MHMQGEQQEKGSRGQTGGAGVALRRLAVHSIFAAQEASTQQVVLSE